MTKSRWANVIAITTAALFVAATAATVVRIVRLEPRIRAVRGPGLIGDAAIFAAIAALAVAAVWTHRVLLLSAAFLVLAFLMGEYASESLLAPVVAAGLFAFLVAYRLMGEQTHLPGRLRTVIVVFSAALGAAALISLHMNPKIIAWHRVREAGKTIELQVNAYDGTCGTLKAHEIESATADAGCEEYVPHQPARAGIAFAAASIVIGIAGVIKAPRTVRMD